MAKPFQVSLAPEKLWQAINPLSLYQPGAQFGFFNINLGQTSRPDIEQEILERVGSYGRQLGRIGDALEVLMDHLKQGDLTDAERDTLTILRGQLAEVRKIKKSADKT
jgi:hypothetical protein